MAGLYGGNRGSGTGTGQHRPVVPTREKACEDEARTAAQKKSPACGARSAGQWVLPARTRETTYALVSVLSHALQGAETLVHDLQDAEAAGDQELVQCLREAQAWQRHLASEAQAVLQQRLHSGEGRVWNPDANIWNLILIPSPDCCLLGGVPHASAPL